MRREIKFRVWSYEDKEYRTDCNLTQVFNSMTGMPATAYSNEGDRFDIEQYTGLKDKNGKEIYEGDIMQSPDGEVKYVVEWDDDRLGFWGKAIGDTPDFDMDKTEENDEIIGNIHENTEVLKWLK